MIFGGGKYLGNTRKSSHSQTIFFHNKKTWTHRLGVLIIGIGFDNTNKLLSGHRSDPNGYVQRCRSKYGVCRSA